MRAVFVELPAFERHRSAYIDDDGFRRLQAELMKNPESGDVIKEAGGLRKLRFSDPRRGKGKRGGLRVIYFWWKAGSQFWLYTVFDKDEAADLSADQRKALRLALKAELNARSQR